IAGTGAAGLFGALSLPRDKKIIILTKDAADKSDSFLAQGGICVQHDDNDYDSFFEDTLRAGHYENDRESVDIMISSSRRVIDRLIDYGTDFDRENGELLYTREGAHSRSRILFHADETGREITSTLLHHVHELENVTILEYYTMVDVIEKDGICCGIIAQGPDGQFVTITADYTVLATGGIGGLFEHSTNFSHLTGDALAIALRHGIKLKNIDYIQIHPTSLYTGKKGRSFLISESVRGEGAVLLNSKGERFTDELQPRDVVANAIYREMEKEGSRHVWLSLAAIPTEEIKSHFPNIHAHCLSEGFDITREPIPVVPSQHYFMGGIDVDKKSRTSMPRLYAVGETSCNGVHGRNRLASNSLLEALVFAERAAEDIADGYSALPETTFEAHADDYENYADEYRKMVLSAIEKEKNSHE
ncbi:MAG: L-aspartate oxidase, partial [Clostridia bacterium]|nr:L-aspartate oxidase [Clostridia bacterium]